MSTEFPAAGKTILIADDNPQILELLEAYLESLGATIVTVRDGEAALESVNSSPPNLVLLDVMMPRKSGFEVCRTLKADDATRAIPIIMVTALNEPGDMERAKECGADHALCKPVNKLELLQRVREYLAA